MNNINNHNFIFFSYEDLVIKYDKILVDNTIGSQTFLKIVDYILCIKCNTLCLRNKNFPDDLENIEISQLNSNYRSEMLSGKKFKELTCEELMIQQIIC